MPSETARLRIASELDRLERVPGLRKADWNADKMGSGPVDGTRKDANVPSDGPDRVPYRIEGNLKVFDITEQVQLAAKALPVGTLVKDEHFTLFEAVGALEIGDPKMDCGFLAPGEKLVDDYDIFRELLPTEVLGIMDQLICCEMAWHRGHPLAQTIFTSHYIDTLLNLEAKSIMAARFSNNRGETRGGPLLHLVLRAYCIGLIKCCDFAIDEYTKSTQGCGTQVNLYEDEDFSAHTYGRQLFTRISNYEVLRELNAAEGWVHDMINEQFSESDDSPWKIWQGIHVRLQVRKNMLHAMDPDESKHTPRMWWNHAGSLLPTLRSTHKLAQPVPESFSEKIQRRLASTVPPKPMVELSFKDAFEKLTQMCKDCEEAAKMAEIGTEDIQRLKAFLWAFSSRKPEPLAYARACLSSIIFGCDEEGFIDIFWRDLQEIVLPVDPITARTNRGYDAPMNSQTTADPRFEMANTVNQFAKSAVPRRGGYVDLFRALCSNRCRLRRTLCHVVTGLDEVQENDFDLTLNRLSPGTSFPLSTWVLHQKMQVMEAVVQLGFELDIYLPDELAGMYWYLAFLADARHKLIDIILSNLTRRLESAHGNDDRTKISKSINLHRSMFHLCRGTAALASALSDVYIYASYRQLVPQPSRKSPFHSPQLRYELRMQPFLGIKLPFTPTYQEFAKATAPFGPYADNDLDDQVFQTLLRGIERQLSVAKEEFTVYQKFGAEKAAHEGIEVVFEKNIVGLLWSTVAANVAATVLDGNLLDKKKSSMDLPKPAKRKHAYWIVPTIKRVER
ncbi:Mak10-domain-containing protein [Venturia nashicola]|uniref:Mak10-domain-containing protein n=1 Tax=Venturia nashicola TaxID=86259 RepID=A0A4Z1NY36_9PEZI|nr:Mak10-domain-containing protein [Venturia nashicola]